MKQGHGTTKDSLVPIHVSLLADKHLTAVSAGDFYSMALRYDTCVKRDQHMCQKRPTYLSKETYMYVKRPRKMTY